MMIHFLHPFPHQDLPFIFFFKWIYIELQGFSEAEKEKRTTFQRKQHSLTGRKEAQRDS